LKVLHFEKMPPSSVVRVEGTGDYSNMPGLERRVGKSVAKRNRSEAKYNNTLAKGARQSNKWANKNARMDYQAKKKAAQDILRASKK
jgi:hypothetical protein